MTTMEIVGVTACAMLSLSAGFVIGWVVGHDAGIRYAYEAANQNTRRLTDNLRESVKWLNGCLAYLVGPTRDRVEAFVKRANATLDFAAPPLAITEEPRQP